MQVDILLLQEINEPSNSSNGPRWLGPRFSRKCQAVLSKHCAIVIFNREEKFLFYEVRMKTDRCIHVDLFFPLPYKPGEANPDIDIGGNPIMRLVSVYADVKYQGRKEQFRDDEFDLRSCLFPSIVGGDFNDFPNPTRDRYPIQTDAEARQRGRCWKEYLAPILEEADLAEVYRHKHPLTNCYSHYQKTMSGLTQTRIDHLLASTALLDSICSIEYRVAAVATDHLSMEMRIDGALAIPGYNNVGRHRWKLHHGYARQPLFIRQLKAMIGDYPTSETYAEWLHFMELIRRTSYKITQTSPFLMKSNSPELELTNERLELHKYLAHHPNPRSKEEETIITTTLARIQALAHQAATAESRTFRTRLQQDELLPTSWLKESTTLHKAARFESLRREDGTMAISSEDMSELVVSFFSERFAARVIPPEAAKAMENLFARSHQRVPPEIYNKLKQPFSMGETGRAIDRGRDGTAIGEDGIPMDLLRAIPELRPHIQGAINALWTTDEQLRRTEPVVRVSLLFKPKHTEKDLIKNYRPVSVENSILTIMNSIPIPRLVKACDVIVTPNQTGFIKGRRLTGNVMQVMLSLDAAKCGLLQEENPDAVLLLMDVNAAYDRVCREWLFHTLRHYGFPQNVISFFEKFYRNPAAQYSVNGTTSELVKLLRGVLQGNPASCILFAIQLQPFLDNCESNEVGITIQSSLTGASARLGVYAYADDVQVLVREYRDWIRFASVTRTYTEAAGQTFDGSKVIFLTGKNPHPSHWHQDIPYEEHNPEKDVIILGCPARLDGNPPEDYLNNVLTRMTNSTAPWYKANLSLLGKVRIANGLILSKLWHATQLCPLPQSFISKVDDKIKVLLFSYRRAFVPFKILCRAKQHGGLGLILTEHMTLAMFGKNIAWLLSNPTSPITLLFGELLLRYIRTEMAQDEPQMDTMVIFTRSGNGWRQGRKRLPPFWMRAMNAFQDLDLRLNDEWGEYSHEEILALPWYMEQYTARYKGRHKGTTPIWETKEGVAMRRTIKGFGIKRWCDLLRHEPRRDPCLQVPPLAAVPHRRRKTWTKIRTMFEKYWDELQPDLQRRLLQDDNGKTVFTRPRTVSPETTISEPVEISPPALLPNLKHWRIAGMEPLKYTVKAARNFVMGRNGLRETVIPEYWMRHINTASDDEIRRDWTTAWKELHTPGKTAAQISALYQVFHGKARKALILKRGEDDTENGLDQCPACQSINDGICHAYFECPKARQFWNESLTILMQTIAPSEAAPRSQFEADAKTALLDTRETLFGFPKLRKKWMIQTRITAWHAITIEMIAQARQGKFRDSRNAGLDDGKGEALSFTKYIPTVEAEIREWCMRDSTRLKSDAAFQATWPMARRFGTRVTFMDTN